MTNYQTDIKKEVFTLPHCLKATTHGGTEGLSAEQETAGYIVSLVRKQKWLLVLSWLPLFIVFGLELQPMK